MPMRSRESPRSPNLVSPAGPRPGCQRCRNTRERSHVSEQDLFAYCPAVDGHVGSSRAERHVLSAGSAALGHQRQPAPRVNVAGAQAFLIIAGWSLRSWNTAVCQADRPLRRLHARWTAERTGRDHRPGVSVAAPGIGNRVLCTGRPQTAPNHAAAESYSSSRLLATSGHDPSTLSVGGTAMARRYRLRDNGA